MSLVERAPLGGRTGGGPAANRLGQKRKDQMGMSVSGAIFFACFYMLFLLVLGDVLKDRAERADFKKLEAKLHAARQSERVKWPSWPSGPLPFEAKLRAFAGEAKAAEAAAAEVQAREEAAKAAAAKVQAKEEADERDKQLILAYEAREAARPRSPFEIRCAQAGRAMRYRLQLLRLTF